MVQCQVFLQSYISSCFPTYFLRTSSLLPWFLKCGRIQMRCWNFGRIYKKVTTQDVRACHCPLLCTRWRGEGSATFRPTACQVFSKQHWRWRWENPADLRSWTLAVVPLKQLIPSFFRVSSSEDYLSNTCPTGRQFGSGVTKSPL